MSRSEMEIYFTQQFGVDPDVLAEYGAFDISVVSDLPLFIDPFLLFNSAQAEYQELHDDIIKYLLFLRDKADAGLDDGLIANWYRFKEVGRTGSASRFSATGGMRSEHSSRPRCINRSLLARRPRA